MVKPDAAQLSSTVTALAELTDRVCDMADRYADGPLEEIATELYEVERSLQAAGRRLERLVDRLGSSG